jgi:competence protein ComEA
MEELFNYSASERRGIVFLMCLILSINLGDFLYLRFFPPPSTPPAEELKYLSAFEASNKKSKSSKYQKYVLPERSFNPNNYDTDDWQKLGFTFKQSEAIIKSSRKRKFKTPEDVKNLFCMPPDYYLQLKDSLILPNYNLDIKDKSSHKTRQTQRKDTEPININSADSLEILQLPGIGPYWTKRILRARNQWGGFCCIRQISSLKGLPDSIFVKIEKLIIIDPEKIIKVNINTISVEDFSKHPAGWYGVAKSVVNYRNQHGDFHSVGDFSKIYSLKPDKIELLQHYVKFNDDN